MLEYCVNQRQIVGESGTKMITLVSLSRAHDYHIMALLNSRTSSVRVEACTNCVTVEKSSLYPRARETAGNVSFLVALTTQI